MCYDRDSFQKEGAGHENELQHKKINHSKIYHMIYRESKGVSKQEIMRRLGLSLPTVTQKLEELQDEGLVRDAGSADSTGSEPFPYSRKGRTALKTPGHTGPCAGSPGSPRSNPLAPPSARRFYMLFPRPCVLSLSAARPAHRFLYSSRAPGAPPLFSGLGRPFSLISLFPSNVQRKNA